MPQILQLFPPILRLLAVLILAGLFAGCILVCVTACRLLRPPRMRDARALFYLRRLSPADLHLPYRDMNFTVRDARTRRPLRMNAWWIDAAQPSDRTAILIHGYSDSKIGALAWASLFRSLGFNILAIDTRAHGDSQGRFLTAGFFERHDLSQIIDQLKTDQSQQSRRIILFGVSLGAASASATAALRTDIGALILECPYKDFPSAVLSHAPNTPVPGRLVSKLSLLVAEKLAHADFSQVRPIELIAAISCPILIVQSEVDPFVPPSDQAALAAAIDSRPPHLPPAQLWRVANTYHILALPDHPEEYKHRLTQFLDAALTLSPCHPVTPPHLAPHLSPGES